MEHAIQVQWQQSQIPAGVMGQAARQTQRAGIVPMFCDTSQHITSHATKRAYSSTQVNAFEQVRNAWHLTCGQPQPIAASWAQVSCSPNQRPKSQCRCARARLMPLPSNAPQNRVRDMHIIALHFQAVWTPACRRCKHQCWPPSGCCLPRCSSLYKH